MERVYKIRCVNCDDGIMVEEVGAITYRIEDKQITVFNAPIFWCNECEATSYRQGLGINEALEEAFKRDANVIMFRDEDWKELRK